MTVQERVDYAGALVAYVAHASAGGKGNLTDFFPRWRRPKPLVGDGVANWLRAIARQN